MVSIITSIVIQNGFNIYTAKSSEITVIKSPNNLLEVGTRISYRKVKYIITGIKIALGCGVVTLEVNKLT